VLISHDPGSTLLIGDSLSCLWDNDFHTTVFPAAFGRGIRRDGLFLAVAACGDTLSANSILNQKVPYRIRPSLGQIKIIAFLSTILPAGRNCGFRDAPQVIC